jgi:hypothetical protein
VKKGKILKKKMQCINCEYATNKLNELLRHQHQHRFKKNGSFKCFECGIFFRDFRGLKMHVFRNHKNPQSQNNPAPKSQTYFCKKCSSSFNKISQLINHTERKHFVCGNQSECCLCPKILYSKGNFKAHIKRHHSPISSRTDNAIPSISSVPTPEPTSPPNIESDSQTSEPSQQAHNDQSPEQILILMFLKLKARYGVTDQVLQIFYEELKHLITIFSDQILILTDQLANQFINLNDAFRPKFANIQSRFKLDSLSSTYKRRKVFKKQLGFVEPQAINLGKNNEHEDCNYQYVSIKKSLSSLLSEKEFSQKVIQEKQYQQNIYHDYNDGKLYKSKQETSSKDDLIIELIIFSDAFGLCNPLSAISSKYKLNGFYYVIGNFNPALRSKIDNIQLISLCREKHIKYFGWNIFAKHMVSELKSLESGFKVQNIQVKVKLIAVAGDNLGSHALGGFAENFSKVEFFCRYCYYTQSQLKDKDIHLCERRNPENYLLDIQSKKADANNNKGLKFDSVLNELKSNHVCDPGLPPCLGHDLFHGAFALDLQLVIKGLVDLQIFNITFLNTILRNFVKLYRNFNSFPKLSIKNKKLRGSMSEIYKMITVMPYILLHAPNKNEDLFSFILSMVRITQLVTAPSISSDQILILEEEIDEYFRLRLHLFPDEQWLPKHHFLRHYPELLRLFGPLSKFSTLPFEHKHQYFKNMVMHSKNFINEPKTLAERHQLLQVLLKNDRFQAKIATNSAQLYDHAMLNVIVGREIKFIATSTTYNHQKFSENDLIVFGFDEETQIIKVMDIKYMLISEGFDKLLFLGQTINMILNYQTELYEPTSEFTSNYSTVPAEDLLIFKPINGYKFKNKLFISLPFTFPIIY